MKRIRIALTLLMFIAVVCYWFCLPYLQAEMVTLDQSETLSVPTAPTLKLMSMCIDGNAEKINVKYQWLDSTNKPVSTGRDVNQVWVCENSTVANAACVASGDPDVCCTGSGTGTCMTCWDDVMKYTFSAPDAGKKMGQRLKQLVWSKMKGIVLKTPGNDGTFAP